MRPFLPVAWFWAGLFFMPDFVFAQCTGTCPTGSITTLPTGSASAIITIPAGTTYCVAGPLSTSAQYVINGTLIVSSGVVTLGTVTLNSTGVINVETAAELAVTSNFNGSTGVAAAAFSNINICSNGFLNLLGVFNQGEINIALASNAVMLVQASWASLASDVTVKIGAGALIEVCASLFVVKSGFLTETSAATSYLFNDGAAAMGGWISGSQAASMVDWTVEGSESDAEYPASRACINCGNLLLAPPGASAAACGVTAGNYITAIVLPVTLIEFNETIQGGALLIDAGLLPGKPAQPLTLEYSTDGKNFYPGSYPSGEGSTIRTGVVRRSLPRRNSTFRQYLFICLKINTFDALCLPAHI